jgi:hypothetical protein
MAVTGSPSGKTTLNIELANAFSGDRGGDEKTNEALQTITWVASGGTPTISGWVKGTITAAAGDWLMAHATDPFGTMGDATYCTGGAPSPGVSKLKMLYVRNTHATESITVAQGAASGLPGIFAAAGDGVIVQPGGIFLWYDPDGTAALTTTSNDKLTISVSSGSPSGVVIAAYGP